MLDNPWNRPDDFEPRELMVGAGISTEVYNQWLYRDIFTATHQADGPGTVSSYSFADIVTVAVIVELRKLDMRLKKAKILAREVIDALTFWQNADNSTDWPSVYISFSDRGAPVVDVGKDKSREVVIRLNLHSVISNVCGRIDDMPPMTKKPRAK